MSSVMASHSKGIRPSSQTNRSATTAACLLYALPREIYDTILAYAYPHNPQLTIMHSADWSTWEQEKQRLNPQHVSRPFPAPKVEEWLVSKRYFRDASQTWLAAQDFPLLLRCAWTQPPELLPPWARTSQRSEPTTYCVTTSNMMLSRRIGLFYTYATFADVPSSMIPTLLECQSLKHVKIELQPEDFEIAGSNRCGWSHYLTNAELDVIRVKTGLSRLPAYTNLVIYQPQGPEVRWPVEVSDLQKLILQSNVLRLQTLTRQMAKTKAVVRDTTWSYAPRPLYMWSKVKIKVSDTPGFVPYWHIAASLTAVALFVMVLIKNPLLAELLLRSM